MGNIYTIVYLKSGKYLFSYITMVLAFNKKVINYSEAIYQYWIIMDFTFPSISNIHISICHKNKLY